MFSNVGRSIALRHNSARRRHGKTGVPPYAAGVQARRHARAWRVTVAASMALLRTKGAVRAMPFHKRFGLCALSWRMAT